MYLDFLNLFDNDAAITVTRNSMNVIDLLRAAPDIGTGEDLFVVVTVTTAFTADGAATLHVAVVSDDDASLSSPTVLQDQAAVIAVASLVVGYKIEFRIHPSAVMEQYLGLVYTVASGPMTAGKLTAGIAKDVRSWKAFPSNFVSA